eukprot:1101541-Prymnesium_polylepis.2
MVRLCTFERVVCVTYNAPKRYCPPWVVKCDIVAAAPHRGRRAAPATTVDLEGCRPRHSRRAAALPLPHYGPCGHTAHRYTARVRRATTHIRYNSIKEPP